MDRDSNKLTDKLLENDQELDDFSPDNKQGDRVVIVSTPGKTKSQTPQENSNLKTGGTGEKESYTISDTPDRFVCSIFESLNRMEARNKTTIGRGYIIFATLMFAVLAWMKSTYIPHLPSLEVIFVMFLVTFIMNYYLLNGALFKPFLENDDNSYSIKLCGGLAVGFIACFYYALNFISTQSAIVIFNFGFIGVILLELFVLNESYTKPQLILAAGSFIGMWITVGGQDFEYWQQEITSPNGFWGFCLSLAAAAMLAIMMINFGKMYDENFASMNHIFSMMIVLFLPVFFPIQGVHRPTGGEWLLLILMGVMNTAAVLSFIRGLQIENPGNVSIFLYLQPALTFFLNMLSGAAGGFGATLGAIICIASLVLYSRETRRKIIVRETFIQKEGKIIEELREMNQDAI